MIESLKRPVITIKPEEVLRMLPDVPEHKAFLPEVTEVIAQSAPLLHPAYFYRVFDSIEIERDSLNIGGKQFCCGKKIINQLKNSTRVAVAVCTVGTAISRLYRQYSREFDFMKAYFCDALANVATEKTMQLLKEDLLAAVRVDGCQTTSNFGPGYCRWDIKEQGTLFQLLPSDVCGIHVAESSLMHPVKSLSGIVGIGPEVVYQESGCTLCLLKTCAYRKNRFKNQPSNEI